MIVTLVVLFGFTMMGGLLSLVIGFKPENIRYPLVFAGSFLFAITIIHILPEVFSLGPDPMKIGMYILVGFFLQQILEYFSSGIEHGHFHVHAHPTGASRWSILVALMIHSVLEGALLTHESPFHGRHESYTLLIGILLHHMPAAFALMTTLKTGKGFTAWAWVTLVVFSLSSPLGLVISEQVLALSQESLLILFALVSGSFLHVSTTIFVESSPQHRFGLKKILVSVGGAAVAILAEYLM